MWFYLRVEFPQDRLSKLFTFDNASPQGPSLSHLHLFLPLLIAMFLSPLTVRLLHNSGPNVPHIIISEDTHTAHTLQHRWVARSLSDRWIGKYLLSQIVFLPLSSFHPSTHRLPLYTFMPHSSFFPCCRFYRVLLSQWSRLHLITGPSQASVVQTRSHTHAHILNIWWRGWLYVYGNSYTRVHVWGPQQTKSW